MYAIGNMGKNNLKSEKQGILLIIRFGKTCITGE